MTPRAVGGSALDPQWGLVLTRIMSDYVHGMSTNDIDRLESRFADMFEASNQMTVYRRIYRESYNLGLQDASLALSLPVEHGGLCDVAGAA